MAHPVQVNLPPHYRGDRFPGFQKIGPITINGSAPADHLTRIRAQFRRAGGAVFTFDSDASASPDAPITILDAALWEATVPGVNDFVPKPGIWDWDMEFHTDGELGPITLYRGSLYVRDDITKTP